MTYFSFCCFLQLYNFVPYSHGANIYPSVVLCLTILFISLTIAIFFGFAVWVFARNIFRIDYCKQDRLKSYLFFCAGLAVKFVSGFLHAYVDNPSSRMLGLLIINCLILAVLILCRRALEHKTYLSIEVLMLLCRVLLHLQLMVEIKVPKILLYLGPA
jgi:hypothetical protein